MYEVLVTIAAIAIILFNIIGIIRLGLSLDHPFLVTIAYIVVLVVIGNINGDVCLFVALAVAVISLLACIIGIVLRCKEAIEEIRLEKEQKQRNVDLLEAVKNGDVESAKMLIEKGGDIEYCDSEKQEPMLQIAIKKSDKEMVTLLIEKGANVNLDNDGKCPLDYANNEEIIALLRSHGAKTKEEIEEEKRAEEERKRLEAEEANNMGYSYFNGIGVDKDYEKAVEFWKKAVSLGNVQAHNSLAICYLQGFGVEKDYDKVFNLSKVAAEKGIANAQCNLGNCYYNGIGVYRNKNEGVKWFEKAAEQGHSVALLNLGSYYESVFYYDKAIEMYEKAVELGETRAYEKLKELSNRGLY